jgi:hypothetical protein
MDWPLSKVLIPHEQNAHPNDDAPDGTPVETWQDIYAWDRTTAKMLNSIPEIPPSSPLTVFTYRDYPFDRPKNVWHEWVALLVSTVKLIEPCTLWINGDFQLCWISSLSWLYFFASSIMLQFWREWLRKRKDSANDQRDLLAGDLPTTKRPGGPRRVVLGTSGSDRMLLAWKVVWGVGIVISIGTLGATYVFVSTSNNRTFYIWGCLQFVWLILSLLFSYFSDVIDPMTHRWLLAPVSRKALTKSDKTRILGLAFATAKYQLYHHPRGMYCYDEELLCTQTLSHYLHQIHYQLQAAYPLDPTTQPGDIIHITIAAVIGDPTLTSTAWIQGSSHSGMDVYDSCIVFARVQGALVAIPTARVLSDPLTSELNVESSGIDRDILQKGSTNTGRGISWWYWIPCGPDRWLQVRTEELRFLGTREAEVLTDMGVTEKLQRGRLVVSLRDVGEVRGVVSVSREVGDLLIDLAR